MFRSFTVSRSEDEARFLVLERVLALLVSERELVSLPVVALKVWARIVLVPERVSPAASEQGQDAPLALVQPAWVQPVLALAPVSLPALE